MNPAAPQLYRVFYADRVKDRLLALVDEAEARGDGVAFLAAVAEFDRRLHLYPQFGDPLSDLTQHPGHIRIGIIQPLSMRYAVFEDRREVSVGALPVLLRKRPS